MLDLLIVGRGIAGLTLASQAVEQGFQVGIVASKRYAPASKAAVGMSAMKGLQTARNDFFASKLRGHDEFAQTLGRAQAHQSKQIWQLGVWETFQDSSSYQKVCERIYHNVFRQHEDVQTLMTKSVRPGSLATQVMHDHRLLGALYYPRDYSFSPTEALSSLECHLKKQGVQFFELDVQRVASKSVVGADETLRAQSVVVAAGASTPQILQASGYQTERPTKWRETPGITYEAPWRGPAGAIKWGQSGLVAVAGVLRFGSDDSEEPRLEDWLQLLREQYGILVDACDVTRWQGVRMRAQGRKPVVAAAYNEHREKIWVLSGFHRNGYTLATHASKELLAKLVGN